jgi:hypothetical protein
VVALQRVAAGWAGLGRSRIRRRPSPTLPGSGLRARAHRSWGTANPRGRWQKKPSSALGRYAAAPRPAPPAEHRLPPVIPGRALTGKETLIPPATCLFTNRSLYGPRTAAGGSSMPETPVRDKNSDQARDQVFLRVRSTLVSTATRESRLSTRRHTLSQHCSATPNPMAPSPQRALMGRSLARPPTGMDAPFRLSMAEQLGLRRSSSSDLRL